MATPKAICRQEAADLDLSAERIWPSARLVMIGAWRCRLDRGISRRANSVLALGDEAVRSFETALASAGALYRDAGLKPMFQITPAVTPPDLDSRLANAGFGTEGAALVLARTLGRYPRAEQAISLAAEPHANWMDAYQTGRPAGEAAVKAAILKRIACPKVFAAIGPAGERHAVGAAICDGPRGWINCMHTGPDHRRNGLGRALLFGLSDWLKRQGAKTLYLQVETDNLPARRLYESQGFACRYRYHYRSLDEPTVISHA